MWLQNENPISKYGIYVKGQHLTPKLNAFWQWVCWTTVKLPPCCNDWQCDFSRVSNYRTASAQLNELQKHYRPVWVKRNYFVSFITAVQHCFQWDLLIYLSNLFLYVTFSSSVLMSSMQGDDPHLSKCTSTLKKKKAAYLCKSNFVQYMGKQ